MKHTDETRRRLSEAAKRTWKDPTIRAARMVGIVSTPERNAKIAATLMGHEVTETARAKQRVAQRERFRDPAQRELAAQKQRGKKASEESKRKTADALRGRKRGPMPEWWRLKLVKAHTGLKQSPEQRAAQSVRATKQHLEGRSHTVCGHFRTSKGSKPWVIFRSPVEHALMCALEDSKSVVSWEYEFVTLDYKDGFGNARTTVPDFLVKYADHTSVVEAKGRGAIKKFMATEKYEAVTRYCETNGYTYHVVCDIAGLGL